VPDRRGTVGSVDISVGFPAALQTPDRIVRAEQLGYHRAWCYDAPAAYADVWMTLARAADRTSRIGLATGVAVPAYRHVMATASAVATLVGQAPGRVVVGLGPGGGMLMHGTKPGTWKDLIATTHALRALLRGEAVAWNGSLHRLLHTEGVVADRPIEVPILITADSPKAVEVAKEIADGVISFDHPKPEFDWSVVMLCGTVLPDGPVDEDYVMAATAAGAARLLHGTYALFGDAVDQVPGGPEYRALIEQHPVESRHLAVWARHLIDATPEERAVLTPQRARALTFTGTAAELRERLTALGRAGAAEVMYHPAGPDIDRELTAFARMAGLTGR
jgi:5,10-methylenetetrahydromethanopterin reductase